MSLFLSCQSISKAFTTRLLFQELSLNVCLGDRLGLIGPNGSGKSTLLKIMAGIEKADDGKVSIKKGLTIGYLAQSCDFADMEPRQILLNQLHQHSHQTDEEKELLVEIWLSKMGFKETDISAARLSGGWKKRLSLAEQLIISPDLLLLDEPTNHLDLEGILWLEKFLLREMPTYILVSHDRYFLQNMTNRVIEINSAFPGGSLAIVGSYCHFLEKKEEFLQGQISHQQSLASKARKEIEWLQQTPQARTTKSRSRIDSAHELLDELAQVKQRNLQKQLTIDFLASERATKKLLVAKNIAKQLGERLLFHKLDFTLSPGTRLGLMGLNGSGKTTLLRLMMGEITPDQGTLKQADELKIVYFDQHKAKLPDDITLREALCPQGDYVFFRGQSIHVNGWCKRFLFSPDFLDMSLGCFSGGEKARIAIAQLMLQPADLLLLDEPTNDLDIPTLETLEENLLDFPGAIVLITHDRCMLDRICNTLLHLGDLENIQFYADYRQWESSLKTIPKKQEAKPKIKEVKKNFKKKLSYLEKQEYEQIEGNILKLEAQIQELSQELQRSQTTLEGVDLSELCNSIGLAETQIEQLYLRWDYLSRQIIPK